MGAASKYLLRQPASTVEAEPERITETESLRIIVSATGGAACSDHEVAPVAAHLAGPVAAIPPEGHPAWADLASHTAQRRSYAVDNLVMDAAHLSRRDDIRCNVAEEFGPHHHHLLIRRRELSAGRIACAHPNDTASHNRVDTAFQSGDVDLLMYEVEPRAWALTALIDRARAEHGGALPGVVIEAAVVIAQTLAGPSRWDTGAGYTMVDWPRDFRPGSLADTCASIFKQDFIHDRLIERLIEGR